LKPSRTAINRTQYNAEKLADIDGNLANRYIKADAVNDTDSRYALHTILTGQPTMNTLVPDDKSLVDIDTVTMRAILKTLSTICHPMIKLSTEEPCKF
jgi:hypothetical protein